MKTITSEQAKEVLDLVNSNSRIHIIIEDGFTTKEYFVKNQKKDKKNLFGKFKDVNMSVPKEFEMDIKE